MSRLPRQAAGTCVLSGDTCDAESDLQTRTRSATKKEKARPVKPLEQGQKLFNKMVQYSNLYRLIKTIAVFCFFTVKLNAQGMNNDFEYDKEDFNMLFKELKINTFKFPIKQNSGQILDIIIEEYEDKKLINSISIIGDATKAFEQYYGAGIDLTSYFKPKKDSIYFHRFFFVEKDSIVSIKIKTIGLETQKEFSLSGKSTFGFNAFNNFKSEENVKYLEGAKSEILVFLYANSSNEKDKPLFCPTGLSKEQLLEKFYYFIFVSIKPYEKK